MRKRWLDILKCIAIIAVLVDHMNGILYTNQSIAKASYYSVSLFILVMGYTTYSSFADDRISKYHKVINKAVNILIPYIVAVFIYYCVRYKMFSFSEFMSYVVNFNISLPHYYVLLYFQLLVVAPLLLNMLQRVGRDLKGHALELLLGVGVSFVAHITSCYSNINNIYGGGGKLFGGSYLLLLYIGMIYRKYTDEIQKRIKENERVAFVIGIAFVISALVVWRGMCRYDLFLDKHCIFGGGFNPPGVSFMIYAFFIFNAGFILGETIEPKIKERSLLDCILTGMQWIGKRTLYIFLYHLLMIEVFGNHLPFLSNTYVKRVEYMIIMIIGSCLLGEILKKIRKVVRLSYGFE